MDSNTLILDQLRQQLSAAPQPQAAQRRQLYWVEQFFQFHRHTPAAQLDQSHLVSFLSHLSSLKYLTPLTQFQALSALLYLFRCCLKQPTLGLQWQYLIPTPQPALRTAC